ncbi:hypothetical protein DFH11DRAFT_439734 [Phellopilus nigrolimitatus]|nr:hypothetical protein DFH11DRAFT_439734 [Phellopilus nigrolimitatus]
MSNASSICVQVDNVQTCLSRLQSVGLTFVAEAGFISMVSLLFLFGLIVRNVVRYYRHALGKWSLIQEPADAFVLSLFVADLTQSLGAFMDVRWIHRGSVEIGKFCTAQGAIQQLGETSVAMATIIIALHTFVAVWLRKGTHNLNIAYGIIAVAWLTVILFVAVAASKNRNYYNPTPLWCWIGGRFTGERIGMEYIWLWMSIVVSILVYVPLFLLTRGYLVVDETHRWKVTWYREARFQEGNDLSTGKKPATPSLALLAYPCAYSLVVLPVSAARWAAFLGHTTPDAATFFSVFLHDMFGAVNVLLLLTTRPNLLLFKDPRNARPDQNGQGHAPGESPSAERPTSQMGMRELRQVYVSRDENARGDACSVSAQSGYGSDLGDDHLGAGRK